VQCRVGIQWIKIHKPATRPTPHDFTKNQMLAAILNTRTSLHAGRGDFHSFCPPLIAKDKVMLLKIDAYSHSYLATYFLFFPRDT